MSVAASTGAALFYGRFTSKHGAKSDEPEDTSSTFSVRRSETASW
jgi:hypothetical protein